MKTKILISNACAAIIMALSLVGCSDFDNGFTEKEIAFQEAFKKEFGEIDPEQDWNLATRGTLHVDFNEKTNVKIYSAAPFSPGAVMMANYNVSSPSDLGFDMPEGTEEVYVQIMSGKNMLVGGYYKVINGVVEGMRTRAEANDVSNVTVREDPIDLCVYAGGSGDNLVNRNYKLYMLDNVPSSPGEEWYGTEMNPILNKDNGVFGEGKHNWRRYIQPGILEKDVVFTIGKDGGTMSLTLEYFCTGTAINTFAYFYWQDNDIDGKSYPSQEDFDEGRVKLYGLVENVTNGKQEQGDVYVHVWKNSKWEALGEANDYFSYTNTDKFQGTTFNLIYWGDGTPKLEFPKDTHIGFAVTQNRIKDYVKDGDGNYAKDDNGNKYKKAEGTYSTDVVWFSLEDLNINSTTWGEGANYDDQNFPTAATFRVGDKIYLGFEDHPEYDGADLNDLMFWVQGDIIEDIPELIPENGKKQSWVLAYEDLGNSFDWDYNDVVLKVGHVSGENYITITPLAAGGTLASYVKLNGKPIRRGKYINENGNIVGDLDDGTGEIHQLFGVKEEKSGEYIPINADKRGDGNPILCTFKDYYSDIDNDGSSDDDDDDDGDGESDAVEGWEKGFSMTVLGDIKRMGGITLHVEPADGSIGEETVIAYSLDNKGKAPEVFCLPGSWTWTEEDEDKIVVYEREWRWPAEYQHINDAYNNVESNFAGWAKDKKTNTDWYKQQPNLTYCVTGKFDKELYSGAVGGYDPNPDPSGPTFPSDAGTLITEGTEQIDGFYHITSDVILQYIECTITLQISNRNNLYGIFDSKTSQWPNYVEKLVQKEGWKDIYTITLSLADINALTDGLWFNCNNGSKIEQVAIDGIKDNRQTLKIGENEVASDKITKTEQTFTNFEYAYDVDLSNYKLESDFNGTASITIKFTENVTYVGVFTGYDDDWNSISSESIYYGDGKTEFELNITDTSKLSDLINHDGFNVRWNGGTSSNSILSINIKLIEN